MLQARQLRLLSEKKRMSREKTKAADIPHELRKPVIVTDVLDLHGFFPEQVEEVVKEFLLNAVKLKFRHTRIIHGKGKSRLKYEVHKILSFSPYVESFKDCAPDSGGWGATCVVLKIRHSD
ncbi:DNA mismatch repair protein MutS [candidate division KSB1 bacterium]|nr:MAG: DNA mismatch repair protein MutS [candidate division KSB1 bacterium]